MRDGTQEATRARPSVAMCTVERVDDVRRVADDIRHSGGTVGFVPTMGFLHDGHRSLMRAARAVHDVVVVSVFVNPLQFGPAEDLDAYPRDLPRDADIARAEGVDVLFVPSVAEMYPEPPLTTVSVAGLTDGLCGTTRPLHFAGVATVVAKLLAIMGPCHAYFGRKDFQQLAVVRRLVPDLSLPVTVVGCPTVREADGVARSSRNAYLAPAERAAATVLMRALAAGVEAVHAGERAAGRVGDAVAAVVAAEPLATLDYAEVRRADDLAACERLDDGVEAVLALAARIGITLLIDNTTFTVVDEDVVADLPVPSVST